MEVPHAGGRRRARDGRRLRSDCRTPAARPRHARLLGVGVGAAGVVDARAGRILVASDSFRDWAGFAVTAAFEEAGSRVPAFLDNDVNAFLRGEAAAGAVAGEAHVLGMTLGTGVGGALWLDGALYDGPHGAAGEIGHVPGFGDLPCTCGGRGHLETLASGRAIAARYGDGPGSRCQRPTLRRSPTAETPPPPRCSTRRGRRSGRPSRWSPP